MGFVVKLAKSDLVPSQQFTYLGMSFDTVSFSVRPTQARVDSLLTLLSAVQSSPTVSLRRLHKVLGLMESMSSLLPLGRVYKRPLQRETSHRFPPGADWDSVITVGPWFNHAVAQWLNPTWINGSVPIRPYGRKLFIHTDASLTGWGAHCEHGETSALWSPRESSQHINWLELQAVFRALKFFQPHLRQQQLIVICSDNTTSLAYIQHQGGTNSESLSLLAEEILIWSHAHDLQLTVEFIPGRLNVLADQLSRPGTILPTEWTIARSSLRPLWQLWGRPMIDLFATKYSARLPIYVSPVRDPLAMNRNAFAMSWVGLWAYAYPPTALLPLLIEKYRAERPTLILISPGWPSRPWYPELLTLSCVPPVPLRLTSHTLVQPRSGIGHPDPDWLNLTAWLLCAQDCAHKA